VKTNQIIKRNVFGRELRQDLKTGYLNLNDLEKIGNEFRKTKNLPQRPLANFYATQEGKEFMRALSLETGLPIDELRIVKKGRKGGQYGHLILFLEIASWYDQSLKVKAWKIASDELLKYRDASGDNYKEMMTVLKDGFPQYFNSPMIYVKIANKIKNACRISGNGKDTWNYASEYQLKLRDKIQSNIILLADMSNDLSFIFKKAIEKAIKEVQDATTKKITAERD
jgi:hypothetical protein